MSDKSMSISMIIEDFFTKMKSILDEFDSVILYLTVYVLVLVVISHNRSLRENNIKGS